MPKAVEWFGVFTRNENVSAEAMEVFLLLYIEHVVTFNESPIQGPFAFEFTASECSARSEGSDDWGCLGVSEREIGGFS